MRKVVNFSKKKNFWSGEPDLDCKRMGKGV